MMEFSAEKCYDCSKIGSGIPRSVWNPVREERVEKDMIRIKEEANLCLNCKKPRCVAACPIQTPIPQMIQLFKEGRVTDAAQQLFDNNPMSVVCAMVCNHEAQCEGHCIRGIKGAPVSWSSIERYLSDTGLERVQIPKEAPTGKNVAIIGSGPAGITAAIKLVQKGHDVTIFEAESMIGGMLQYGIPEFRLPKSLLERYCRKLKDIGIHIRLHTAIGTSLMISDLMRDGYDAVMISSGLWRARPLGIPGESLPNVCYGIHYLAAPNSFTLHKRLAVIGSGNTAMDVARTALHRGVEYVTVYGRSGSGAADSKELELAELEGADFAYGLQITRITREGPVFRKCVLDENGKAVGVTGEEELHPADFTIIAASQGPKSKLINTTNGLEGTDRGLLKVDGNGMTTVRGVFAAGDVVHGGKTVVEAVAEAKAVAEAIHTYLSQEPECQE